MTGNRLGVMGTLWMMLPVIAATLWIEHSRTCRIQVGDLVVRGTAGTSVSSTDQRRVDTPCSWRIHPAGSGAEEEAIRTTPFGDVEDESHDVPTGYVPEDRPLISD